MTQPAVAATGAAGLDDVLNGGLTPNRLYRLEGMPGSGKTTLWCACLWRAPTHRAPRLRA